MIKITMVMKRTAAFAALLTVFLFTTGCGLSGSGTYTVANDQDSFTEEVDGRKVEYRNWTITIDGKEIPIEKKKSVIRIDNAANAAVRFITMVIFIIIQ